MLHTQDLRVQKLLTDGEFGLEKESLRVTEDGHFAHTKHPFPDNKNIVRDFCENQIEINTGVSKTAAAAVGELEAYTRKIQSALGNMTAEEYLWPFSNPPYIKSENDIPIAEFVGKNSGKTAYRGHLARVYGRYKMTLSGIHVNYSFSDKLLQADFALSGEKDFKAYKNNVYLSLAKGMTMYGWLITLLLAASPICDSSFYQSGKEDEDVFTKTASLRCSRYGYWNNFTPVLSYDSVDTYAQSIQNYIDNGMIASQTELYYPIRLKPKGANSLDAIRENGINHIEIRNVDLNPFASAGIDVRDLEFIQLLILYAASLPDFVLTTDMQLNAAENFKRAAEYDIERTKIYTLDNREAGIIDAALSEIEKIRSFMSDAGIEKNEIIAFEEDKLLNPHKRYAARVIKQFYGGYVKKGMSFVKTQSQQACKP